MCAASCAAASLIGSFVVIEINDMQHSHILLRSRASCEHSPPAIAGHTRDQMTAQAMERLGHIETEGDRDRISAQQGSNGVDSQSVEVRMCDTHCNTKQRSKTKKEWNVEVVTEYRNKETGEKFSRVRDSIPCKDFKDLKTLHALDLGLQAGYNKPRYPVIDAEIFIQSRRLIMLSSFPGKNLVTSSSSTSGPPSTAAAADVGK